MTDLVQWLDKLVSKFSESAGLQKFLDSLTALEPALDHILNGTKLTADQMSKAQDAVSNLTPAIAGLVGAFAFGPAMKHLGNLGKTMGKLAVEAQTSGSVIGNVFGTISTGLLKLDNDGKATAEGFRKAAGQGLSAMSTMANGISCKRGISRYWSCSNSWFSRRWSWFDQ